MPDVGVSKPEPDLGSVGFKLPESSLENTGDDLGQVGFSGAFSEKVDPRFTVDEESIRQRIANSPDPQLETDRVNAAYGVAQRFGVSLDTALDNFEAFAAQLTKDSRLPLSAPGALAKAFSNGVINLQINTKRGEIARRMMINENFAKKGWAPIPIDQLEAEIEALEKKIDTRYEEDMGLPTELLKAALGTLPSMGVQIGGALALGAGAPALAKFAGPKIASMIVMGGKAGITAFTWNQLTGAAYGDFMALEGENGERPSPQRAAKVAHFAGILQTIIENAQVRGLIPGGGSASEALAKRAFANGLLSGAFGRTLKGYLFGVGEEVTEEVLQQMVTIAGREFIMAAENELGGQFERQRLEGVLAELGDTFVQSAMAMSVLGIPRGVGAALEGRKPKTAGKSDEVPSVAGGDVAIEQEPRTPEDIEKDYIEIETKLQDLAQKGDLVEQADIDEFMALREKSIELDRESKSIASRQSVEATPETRTIGKAPASELISLRQRQDIRDMFKNAGPLAADPKAVDFAIQVLWMRANAVDMTVDEYLESSPMRFASAEEFAAANEAEGLGVVADLETSGKVRGVTAFLQDGTALIRVTERGDLTTVIHEWLHIFRRQLSSKDQAVLAKHFGLEIGKDGNPVWTEEAEEAFVKETMAGISQGATDPVVASVFQRMRQWLQRMYEMIVRGGWQISPEVRGVLEGMFSTERTSRAVMGDFRGDFRGDESTLYESVIEEDNQVVSAAEEEEIRKGVSRVFKTLATAKLHLKKLVLGKNGEINQEIVEQVAEEMRRDLVSAIRSGNAKVLKAITWYSDKQRLYRERAIDEVPELVNDSWYTVFLFYLGLTSSGLKPRGNEAQAMGLIKSMIRGEIQEGDWMTEGGRNQRTGEMNPPSLREGAVFTTSEKGDATVVQGHRNVVTGIGKINQIMTIYNKLGKDIDKTAEWLLSFHTGYEIQDFLERGLNSKGEPLKPPGGLNLTQEYLGMEILGPKMGNFALALFGRADLLVKDLWFCRYFYRHTGETEWNQDKHDAPQNKTHRVTMDATVARAAELIKQDLGQEYTASAIQAMLWYLEKEEYKKLGLKTETEDFFDVIKLRQESWLSKGILIRSDDGRLLPNPDFAPGYKSPGQVRREPKNLKVLYEDEFEAQIDAIPLQYNNLGDLRAYNGAKSHLSPRLWKIVRTPAFKAWFGDWEDPENHGQRPLGERMGMVLDSNGEPQVFFHGTHRSMEKFDLSYAKPGEGAIFITPSARLAAKFSGVKDWHPDFKEKTDKLLLTEALEAHQIMTEAKRLGVPSKFPPKFPREFIDANIMPVFIRQRNLAVVDWEELTGGKSSFDTWEMNTLLRKLEREGRDGAYIYNLHEYEINVPQIALFSPTDIKSVFNHGNFSSVDSRLLYETDDDINRKRFAGLSLQQSAETQGRDWIPTEMYAMNEGFRIEREIRNATNSEGKISVGLTEGRYGGIEKSFDIEAEDIKNPEEAFKIIWSIAKQYRQQSAFVGIRMDPKDEVDFTRHRPTLEVYFKEPIAGGSADQAESLMKEYGAEFFTFLVDKSVVGEKAPIVGARVVWLPEFFFPDGAAEWPDSQIAEAASEAWKENQILASKMKEGGKFKSVVSFLAETEVRWGGTYDRERVLPEGVREGGGGGWRGLTVREGIASKRSVQPVRDSWNPELQRGYHRGGIDTLQTLRSESPVPGAVAIGGVAYRKTPGRTELDSSKSGLGIAGAEAKRLEYTPDPRIKRRAYFYVDVWPELRKPEPGLGDHVYSAAFNNLYDIRQDPLDIRLKVRDLPASEQGNTLETMILDAGFDGYIHPEQTMFVILDANPKVTYRGTRADNGRPISGSALLYEEDDERASHPRELAIQSMLESGEFVPLSSLKAFEGNSWADIAISEHMNFLDAAVAAEDESEFREYVDAVELDEPLPQTHIDEYWKEAQPFRGDVEEAPEPDSPDLSERAKSSPHLDKNMVKMVEVIETIKSDLSNLQAYADQMIERPAAMRETISSAKAQAKLSLKLMKSDMLDKAAKKVADLEQRVGAVRQRMEDRLETNELKRMELADQIKSLEDALVSAKAEAQLQTRSVAKEAVKKLRDAQKAKSLIKGMIREITRKPGKSMDAEYAKRLTDLQSQYVISFGRAEAMMRKALPALLTKSTDPVQQEILRKELALKSLRDMSLDELSELALLVRGIRVEGALTRKLKLAERKARREGYISSLSEELEKTGRVKELTDLTTQAQKEAAKGPWWVRFVWPTLRMNRIAKLLGPTFNKLLWDDVNSITDNKLTRLRDRMEKMKAVVAESGLTTKQLGESFVRNISLEEAIHIYIAMKNPDSSAAVIHGNKIPDAQRIADSLPANAKILGDKIMGLFSDEDFDLLQKVFQADQNVIISRVSNYFPMKRTEALSGLTLKQEQTNEFLERSAQGRRFVWNKMGVSRVKIADRHQKAIRLGLLSVAMDGIERQEHYIAFAEHIKDLQSVFGDPRVQAKIVSAYGESAYKLIDEHINAIASPDGYRLRTTMDGVFNAIYRNTTASILAFSATSVLNNIPGVLGYLGDAGPIELTKETLRFTASLTVPAYRRQLSEFVYSRDPQVRDRMIDPVRFMVSQMGNEGFKKIQKAVGTAGFAALEAMDQWTVLIGWRAVYNVEYAKALKEGLDPDAADKRASVAARESTLKNQPSAREKDLASIYRSNGFRWFLMFSQPINQIWNMLVADVPIAVAEKKFKRAFGYIFSIALMGVVYGLLQRKRPQEDEWELVGDMLGQLLGSIPLAGREINSLLTRGRRDSGYTFLPAVGQMAVWGSEAINPDTDHEKKVDAIVKLAFEAQRMFGLPAVQARRMYKTFVSDDLDLRFDPWEIVGGGPEE